jgi:hypothetical protein
VKRRAIFHTTDPIGMVTGAQEQRWYEVTVTG